MDKFMQRYREDVIGEVSGFDRLVLRGTLRMLAVTSGMMYYLQRLGVLLKDFGDFVECKSKQLREASLAEARRLEREIRYLPSAAVSKERIALDIARRDGIDRGLVAVLTCVEPCQSYDIYRNRETKKLELVPRIRKCLFIYQYWIDEELGWMNARVQTWFPFSIQICLNGREWLSRQMDAHAIAYERRDNTFVQIDDVAGAQALADAQLQTDWPSLLRRIEGRVNPAREALLAPVQAEYYWSTHQSEWATDIMFRSPEALAALVPSLVHGAMVGFSSKDVLRFLGKKWTPATGEVTSSCRKRPEGVRVKHTVKQNSVKVYDKQGSVLRVETTLNNVRDFKTFDPEAKNKWRAMRKGVSDLHRRAEVSHASNRRYLDALASLDCQQPLLRIVEPVCRATAWKKQRIRGLRPWSVEDQALLQAVARGEFAINGMRNRDLLTILHPGDHSREERRRLAGRITTKIRRLRAHGVLQKVPKTHRYVLSTEGCQITSAILLTQHAPVSKIARLAA